MRTLFVLLLAMLSFTAHAGEASMLDRMVKDSELAYCKGGVCAMVHTHYTWKDATVPKGGVFIVAFTAGNYTDQEKQATAKQLHDYWDVKMRSYDDQCTAEYFAPAYKKMIGCPNVK